MCMCVCYYTIHCVFILLKHFKIRVPQENFEDVLEFVAMVLDKNEL